MAKLNFSLQFDIRVNYLFSVNRKAVSSLDRMRGRINKNTLLKYFKVAGNLNEKKNFKEIDDVERTLTNIKIEFKEADNVKKKKKDFLSIFC